MPLRLGVLALVLALGPLVARAQDAEVDEAIDEEIDEPPVEDVDADADAIIAAPLSEDATEDSTEAEAPRPSAPPDTSIADQLRQREAVRPFHVAFGTATGIATYATTILGFLTFSDRYGFDPNGLSGCASGSPIFGTEACNSPPYTHMISALTASALFTVTFSLALFMPDPLGVDQGGGEQATLLTIHKALRWGLLGLFVTQLVLGFVTAAGDFDYGTRRDLAIAHLTVGTLTNLAMTTQGVLGSIMEW